MHFLKILELIEGAKEASSSNFISAVDGVLTLLSAEQNYTENFTITNHLVTMKPSGEALVIGDLHGSLESLKTILETSDYVEKMHSTKDSKLIFLGDYGDRGDESAEVYIVALQLKLGFPSQVVLLRGNHEAPPNLMASPHDMSNQFLIRFGENGPLVYRKTLTLWSHLYNAVYVPNRFLMVHGGISSNISSLKDIADAEENSNDALLEDLLWSDPEEDVLGTVSSPRGAGELFGKAVTEDVLEKLKVKILIRGHEASEFGYKINHGSKILTLFSRKGLPYYNENGAYLRVPLLKKFEDATELVPFVYKI